MPWFPPDGWQPPELTDAERIEKLEELVKIFAFPMGHIGGTPLYEPEKGRKINVLLMELNLWSPYMKPEDADPAE